MPPAGRPRPDKAAAGNLVTYLETELDKAAFAQPNPGHLALARLNRAEYRNAIRDLLALEIDAASMLPNDIAGHGFDNNADALTLSPMLTERYLGAAAKISQMALARPRGVPMPETFFVPTDRNQSRARQRRSAAGIARRRGAALLLPCRRRVPVRDAARKRAARAAGSRVLPPSRISSTSPSITSRWGPSRWVGRNSRRGAARGAGAARRLSARGSQQENPRAADVPRAGQGRVSPGAGVLRLEDDSVRRRSVRPVAASRALPGRQRRAREFPA